ncbi:MAG: sigma-70 family RNA polymerase sigma factor [Gemmatimonadota bacterium]
MTRRRSEPGPSSPEHAAVLEECLLHMDALYRSALRMTRNPQDAEDLVQDTYLKATRSVDRYRETAGVRAWLFRILTNAWIDRYRSRRRTPETVELTEEGGLYDLFLEGRGEASAPAPTAGSAADWTDAELEDFLRKSVGDEVKVAIESLPPGFRLAFLLRDVEGFSYREIAEITGVPIGTVMSRLHRARQALQERLARHARTHGDSGLRADSGP